MYMAEFDGRKFILTVPNYDSVIALIVTPEELEDGDERCIKVVQSTDTDTLDVDYSVVFPEIFDGEHDMWAGAMQCAAVFMMSRGQVVDGDSE